MFGVQDVRAYLEKRAGPEIHETQWTLEKLLPHERPLKLDFKSNPKESFEFALDSFFAFLHDSTCAHQPAQLAEWVYVYLFEREVDMLYEPTRFVKLVMFGTDSTVRIDYNIHAAVNTTLFVFLICSHACEHINTVILRAYNGSVLEEFTPSPDRYMHVFETQYEQLSKIDIIRNTGTETKVITYDSVTTTDPKEFLPPQNILHACGKILQVDEKQLNQTKNYRIPTLFSGEERDIIPIYFEPTTSAPREIGIMVQKLELKRAIEENYVFGYENAVKGGNVDIHLLPLNIYVWFLCLGDVETNRKATPETRQELDVILQSSICLLPIMSRDNHLWEFGMFGDIKMENKEIRNAFLNIPRVLLMYGKTCETEFKPNRSQMRLCKQVRWSKRRKFTQITALLDRMMSRSINQRFGCGIKWATSVEMLTWIVSVASLLFSYKFDFSSVEFDGRGDKQKFSENINSVLITSEFVEQHGWIRAILKLAPKDLIFVWSNKAFQTITKEFSAKVLKVLTIRDFFKNIPFVNDSLITKTPYARFLVNNKHCGFYAFDKQFYSNTMEFPVPMSEQQWIECTPSSEDFERADSFVQKPTIEDQVALYTLISSILRFFVLKPFIEQNPPTSGTQVGLKSRYSVFIQFCKGLKEASKAAKKNTFAYADLEVSVSARYKNRLKQIFKDVFDDSVVKFVQRPMFEDFDVFIRRDLLFVFEEELRDVPEPMDTISGMNVRAQLCLELSKLDANNMFPDVLGVLFEDLYEGWNERLRSLKTIWMQERYFRMPRAVLVETERRDRGQLVHRVRWPDNKKACFNLCVTMHIPDRTRAVAVFDKWYKQTFTGEGPVYMKKLYGFMAAKAEEDESEGWRV